MNAIGPFDRLKIAWVHTFYRACVYTIFVLVRSAAVMCVYSAGHAKIMLCCAGIPLVKAQIVGPFDDLYTLGIRGCDSGNCAAAAKRAIATPYGVQPVGQCDFKFDSATMAGQFMRSVACHFRRVTIGMDVFTSSNVGLCGG